MNRKWTSGWILVACFVISKVSLLCAVDNISGRLKMAYEAHKRGMYSLSNSQIDKYLKENPSPPDVDYAHLLYGVNLLYLEEVDKAIDKLNIIVKKRPESEFLKDAMTYLVLAYLKKTDIASAISLYSEYKNRFSSDDSLENQIAQVVLSTAVTLFKKGDIKKSREFFSIISKLNISKYMPEALYYEGLTYYQENDFDKAIELFKKASEMSQTEQEQKEILADIYLKLGDCFLNKKDYSAAEHYFNRVCDEFPDTIYSSWASFQMSIIEKRKGNLEKAVSLLEGIRSSEEDIQFKVLSELANVKMLQEKWEESETYLKEITELKPEDKNLSDIYIKLGFVNFNMGEYEESIIYFKKVLEISSDSKAKEDAYFWLGYTYYIKNLFDDSQKVWEKLRIEFPDSRYIHEILFFTGKRYYESGRYTEADRYFSELITKFPESSFYETTIEMLIDSKIQQGKLNEALQLCDEFLKKGKNETISFLYGKTLFLLKDFKKAKSILEKLQSVKPSEKVEATYYLANIYEKQGEIDKAQEKYLEIITFFTDFPEWVRYAEENLKRLKK
ncbi:MAG: tetratricopeptide repeat protein [bacterium]|nr:tetratricopeptide repeat protein [bacterium]